MYHFIYVIIIYIRQNEYLVSVLLNVKMSEEQDVVFGVKTSPKRISDDNNIIRKIKHLLL